MKEMLNYLKLGFAVVLAMLVASCAQNGTKEEIESLIPKERKDITLSRSEKEIVNLTNDYSLKFFDEICKLQNANQQIVVSPISASMVMAMFANGAVGETQSEIINALGFDVASMDAVNTFNYRLREELAEVDNTSDISLANSIWVDNSVQLKQSFLEDNTASYGAEIFHVNIFNSIEEINAWCSEKTHGLIQRALDRPLDIEVAMINATYFKGTWSQPFNKDNTVKRDFANMDGTKSSVEFMNDTLRAGYSVIDGVQNILLPYGNGAYQLMLMLPVDESGIDIRTHLRNLRSGDISMITDKTLSNEIKLFMPKFDLSFKGDVYEVFKELGVEKLYGPDADMSAMIDGTRMNACLEQKARIIVDEEGTEAAAVTLPFVVTNSGAFEEAKVPEVVVDRPFCFIIREISTGTILFMGSVNRL